MNAYGRAIFFFFSLSFPFPEKKRQQIEVIRQDPAAIHRAKLTICMCPGYDHRRVAPC